MTFASQLIIQGYVDIDERGNDRRGRDRDRNDGRYDNDRDWDRRQGWQEPWLLISNRQLAISKNLFKNEEVFLLNDFQFVYC